MSDHGIDYTPPPTVGRMIASEAFYNFIVGPVGSAKTTGILFKILYHASRQKPGPDGKRRTRWVVVRNTAPQLKDTTINSFMTWFKPGQAGKWVSGRMMFVFEFGDVYAEVLFRPLDTPDDVSRVLSLEVTGAILDEFVEIPKEVVEALSARCGRYPSPHEGGPTWWGMWGASNPGNEDNWWYDWLDVDDRGTRPKNLRFFQQPPAFSPRAENIDNLPGGIEYYHNLCEGKSKEWIKQFVEVQWGFSLSGKPVYQTFNPDLHVAKEPLAVNPHKPVVIGFDAGLTPAAIFGQQDAHGRVLVLDELTSENMGAKRFCRELLLPKIRERFSDNPLSIVCDPAANHRAQTDERSVLDILEQELGIEADMASSNALPDRLDAVERYLNWLTPAGPSYLVDKRCSTLIRGFRSGYHYTIDRKGAVAPKPDKKNPYSHPHDANQYMCLGFTDVLREQRLDDKFPGLALNTGGNMSSYTRWS